MPQKIRQKEIAPRSRPGINKRKTEQAVRCKGNRQDPANAAIIAHSLFALTLKPKGGFEVLFPDSKTKGETTDDVYKDLKKSFDCICKSFEIAIDFDPIKYLDKKQSIDWMSRKLKEVLHRDIEVRFFKTHEGYFYQLNLELDSPEEWIHFNVKKISKHLKRNPDVEKLFVLFLRMLQDYTNVPFWWEYPIDYAEDVLSEDVERAYNEPEDFNEKQRLSLLKTAADYKEGAAKKYQAVIRTASKYTPAQLMELLVLNKSKNKLLSVMKKGCAFLNGPRYSIGMFEKEYDDGEDWDGGLRFCNQVNIMWDDVDHLGAIYEDIMNAESQEGIWPPVYCINGKGTGIKEKIEGAGIWFNQLVTLFSEINNIQWK